METTVTPENIDDFVDKAINACYERANQALEEVANRQREVPKPKPKPEPKPESESKDKPREITGEDFRTISREYGFDIRKDDTEPTIIYAYDSRHPLKTDWYLNVAMRKPKLTSRGTAIGFEVFVGKAYVSGGDSVKHFDIAGMIQCFTVEEFDKAMANIAKSRDELFNKKQSTKHRQNKSRA